MSKSAPETRPRRLRGLLDETPPHASTARASLGGALGDSLRLPTALASAFPPPPAPPPPPSLCRATASSTQPTAKPTTLTILPTRTDLLPRRSAHRGTTPPPTPGVAALSSRLLTSCSGAILALDAP